MKLLAAVDLNARADDVVAEAARWAERLGATVDLLYVDDTPDAAVFVGDPAVRAIVVEERDKLLGEHTRRVNALRATLPEAHRGTASCVAGVPAEVILERSARYDAILVATHGRTGLAHLWLGSVAEKIVRFAPTPVIVTRLPATEA